MLTTEQIAKEIVESINEDIDELHRFIDFVKTYILAIKIAFRCDRAVSWEILGAFLNEFEKIGMYRSKYDKQVDEVARRVKSALAKEPLDKRMKVFLKEANHLKEEFERDHIDMSDSRVKRLSTKGKRVPNK